MTEDFSKYFDETLILPLEAGFPEKIDTRLFFAVRACPD